MANSDHIYPHTISEEVDFYENTMKSLLEKNCNNIFRGKDLGTISGDSSANSFCTTHGITNGIFKDIFIGDYVKGTYAGTANTIFRVAGIDTYYNTGDISLTKHHVVLVPDKALTTAAMNATNTTGVVNNSKGAYLGSNMHCKVIPTIDTNLTSIFGTHLLQFRDLLANSINATIAAGNFPGQVGASNNWEWVNVKSVLMSESEVYGGPVFSSSGYDTGIAKAQLPLFRLAPQYISSARYWYWLKNVASSADFCRVYGSGHASAGSATDVLGVRPRFLIG